MVSAGLGRYAALAASMLALLTGAVQASARAADPAAASLTDIRVLFKLDPRLSGPTYGGERWLSRPTFASGAQEGTVGKVDVKVQGVDAIGRVVSVVPEWTPADPEMVTVTAGENSQFRITVKRPGESKLRVASQGVSRELVVKARNLVQAIQVEIIQQPVREARRAGADPGATVAQPSPDPGRVAAAAEAPVLRDEKAKNSYALGMEMGGRLKGEIRELDPDLVARGLRDAMAGDEPLLTEAELKAALAAVQSAVRTKRTEARVQLGEKNRKGGEAFLAENKTKEGVVTLESGLQYKVLTAGDGKKPAADDTVVCHYRGTLIDGKEFDNSHKRKSPATFPLKRVIKGWSEALQLMPVGSKWQLFIPTNLAYGERGSRRTIGPNATLVLEVELISIRDTTGPAAEAAQRQGETRPGGEVGQAIVGAAAVKQLEFTVLVRAIHAVAAGEVWANRHATSEALEGLTESSDRASKTELTQREQQIADACSRGLRNKEIAARLNISTKTVKSHLNNVFRKLRLDNRVALALHFRPKVLGLPL